MMRLLLPILLFSWTFSAFAADLEREKRLASEVEAALVVGDAVYLEADSVFRLDETPLKSRAFLAVYAESETDDSKGAAIVLHGRGLHPNWPQVTAPLRIALSEQSWNTLSIQLPVLHKKAKYYDYVPLFPAAVSRIQAALDYLREQGEANIVLVAHSCGVHMSMAYIEQLGDNAFSAYVGIGMGATDTGQLMPRPFPLDRMTIPVLDIYGSEDYGSVQKNAAERLAAIEKNPQSKQVIIAGAGHNFETENSTEALVSAVTGWLDGLADEAVSRRP